jgi:hypothetical protein
MRASFSLLLILLMGAASNTSCVEYKGNAISHNGRVVAVGNISTLGVIQDNRGLTLTLPDKTIDFRWPLESDTGSGKEWWKGYCLGACSVAFISFCLSRLFGANIAEVSLGPGFFLLMFFVWMVR